MLLSISETSEQQPDGVVVDFGRAKFGRDGLSTVGGGGGDKRRKRSLGEDWKEERMQEKGVEVLRVMGDVAYAAICGLRSLQIPLTTARTSKYSTRAASNTN